MVMIITSRYNVITYFYLFPCIFYFSDFPRLVLYFIRKKGMINWELSRQTVMCPIDQDSRVEKLRETQCLPSDDSVCAGPDGY